MAEKAHLNGDEAISGGGDQVERHDHCYPAHLGA
jgi:hypothetical protein